MKKLTKIMLSLAAASALTAAMAVTAMAENHVVTGSYNNETGLVTLNDVLGSGKSQTILVLDSNEDIAYINQIDNNSTFPSFMLEAGLKAKAPVTYNIKIGGSDKSLQTGTLTIEADAKTVTIKFGDIDQDRRHKINSDDTSVLMQFIAGMGYEYVGEDYTVVSGWDGVESFKFGDINQDRRHKINSDDTAALMQFIAGIENGDNVNVGKEVVVLDKN